MTKQQRVLEAVSPVVGLLVDKDVVDGTSGTICPGRACGSGGNRILRNLNMTVGRRELRGPLSTGVVLPWSTPEGYRGHCIATAGHVCILAEDWLQRSRFIRDLRDLGAPLDGSKILAPKHYLHFEKSEDRDLAILALDHAQGVPTARLPPEGFALARDEEVYVVGHSAGRALQALAATVMDPVPSPASPPWQLRGQNLLLEEPAMPCLSGAPVFAWRSESPVLVGLLKGNAPTHIELFIERMSAWLASEATTKSVAAPMVLSDALGRLAGGARRKLLARAAFGLDGVTAWLDALGDDGLARALDDPRCQGPVPRDAYMVFLGGALSMSLYR